MSEHDDSCNKVQEGGNIYAFECDCGASDDETMVDLGGGMVVPLRELMDDDDA